MSKRRMKVMLVAAYVLVITLVASAKPAFMDRYNNDPLSKPELRGKCTVCHVGRGGGERNDFGEAFEDAGYRITSKLRSKFPSLFEQKTDQPR